MRFYVKLVAMMEKNPQTGLIQTAPAIARRVTSGSVVGPSSSQATMSGSRGRGSSCLVVLMPGIVDPHCHLGVKYPYPEDMRTETAAAARGGVTTVLGGYNSWFNRSMTGYYVNSTSLSSNSVSFALLMAEFSSIPVAASRKTTGTTG